jgi:hypothetical protein
MSSSLHNPGTLLPKCPGEVHTPSCRAVALRGALQASTWPRSWSGCPSWSRWCSWTCTAASGRGGRKMATAPAGVLLGGRGVSWLQIVLFGAAAAE